MHLRLVKLHTTASTNSYLKEWIRQNTAENFVVVTTEEQTEGRGQRGNIWYTESSKNLIFSVLIKINKFSIDRQFELNQAISLGIVTILKNYAPQIKIKWPNDIMADKSKIGGILIENTVSSSTIKYSIVGVGLNINQTHFPAELPNASSLKNILKKDFVLDDLLQEILLSIKEFVALLDQNSTDFLQKEYVKNLYFWQQKSLFQDTNQRKFEGKIIGVSNTGKLQVKRNSEVIQEFGFQEIKFIQD